MAGREVMNTRQATEFMGMTYNAFRLHDPAMPRRQISKQRYVYLREDLLEWLRSR